LLQRSQVLSQKSGDIESEHCDAAKKNEHCSDNARCLPVAHRAQNHQLVGFYRGEDLIYAARVRAGRRLRRGVRCSSNSRV